MKNIKVIFDTNVWISFLIGKRLAGIQNHISSARISIITTPQLLEEIRLVTEREKLKKYFPQESVSDLIGLLDIIAIHIEVKPIFSICRDTKDNFLLDLIHFSEADYLVTGDKDLLSIRIFETAEIVSPGDFEKIFS